MLSVCLIHGWSEGSPNYVCQVDVGSVARCGLAWHPDGSLLAAAGASNDIVVYERLSWDPVMELQDGHTGPVNCLQFSPNGEQIDLPCTAC